jgi:ABC-type sugar transport system ATPase subunit
VIQQVDAPDVLYSRPANRFVASFIGSPAMNFLRARVSGNVLAFGAYRFDLPPGRSRALADGEVLLGLRPEHFVDPRHGRHDAAGTTLPVTVELTEQLGSETLLYFRADGVEAEGSSDGDVELGGALVARLDPRTQAAVGERLTLAVDVERAHFFDPATGSAL